MRKIFLTSGLVICMACPAFATDITGPGTEQNPNNECVENILGADGSEGHTSADIEAKWIADQFTVTYNKGAHAADGVNNFTDTDGATYDQNYAARSFSGATNAGGAGMTAATGYTFAGWTKDTTPTFTGRTLNNPWTGETPWNLTAPLTVYAGYTPNIHQISYATGTAGQRDTGFSGTMADTDATYDASVTLRTNAFSIPGYDFAGWTSTVNLASGATAASSYEDGQTINPYKVDADVTLTAQWTAKNYTISYGSGAHGSVPNQGADPVQFANGLTYDATWTTKTFAQTGIAADAGYTFASWNTAADGTGTTYAANTEQSAWTTDGGLTLYAIYTANQYTLSYNCGSPSVQGSQSTAGGTVPASETISMDGNYELATNTCTMPGYTFAGWSCPNLPGTKTLPASAQTKLYFAEGATGQYGYAGDIECTAQWTPNSIGLTWYPDEGSNEAISVDSASQSCSYDGTITLPEDPTKTGYTFNGWKVRQAAAPAQEPAQEPND